MSYYSYEAPEHSDGNHAYKAIFGTTRRSVSHNYVNNTPPSEDPTSNNPPTVQRMLRKPLSAGTDNGLATAPNVCPPQFTGAPEQLMEAPFALPAPSSQPYASQRNARVFSPSLNSTEKSSEISIFSAAGTGHNYLNDFSPFDPSAGEFETGSYKHHSYTSSEASGPFIASKPNLNPFSNTAYTNRLSGESRSRLSNSSELYFDSPRDSSASSSTSPLGKVAAVPASVFQQPDPVPRTGSSVSATTTLNSQTVISSSPSRYNASLSDVPTEATITTSIPLSKFRPGFNTYQGSLGAARGSLDYQSTRNHSFDAATLSRIRGQRDQDGVPLSQSISSMSISSVPSKTAPVQKRKSELTTQLAPARSPRLRRHRAYPAILSDVAYDFISRLQLGDRIKNGVVYTNAFTGEHAVSVLLRITRTADRNLALLVGRALDAQKMFHDVTYDHRLRDSFREVYQLSDPAFNNGYIPSEVSSINEKGQLETQAETMNTERKLPIGVFTILTNCYSPTCVRSEPCYSATCPWRVEQQQRMYAKMRAKFQLELSQSSSVAFDDKEQKLWIYSVPKEIADSVSEREKKRQEVICEVIYTERDFVKDLEYLRDYWIKPLYASNCIPEAKKEKFIRTVFLNALEVHSVNSKLAEALTVRQNKEPVVQRVADIFLEFVPRFEPFIRYGAGQLYGKYEFETEKANNPAFAKFVYETERLKESRKLELNGYLTKPTTRLARYPLLLSAVLKYTDSENSDTQDIPKVIELIKEFLTRLNVESGKAENRFNLMQLNKQLLFKPGEHYELHLLDDNRQLIFKGPLKKKNAGSASFESSSDVHLFLFDNALLLVKPKTVSKRQFFKVHQRPMSLMFLRFSLIDDSGNKMPTSKKYLLQSPLKATAHIGRPANKMYPFNLQLLGKKGYEVTLYASTEVGRDKWQEHIERQQQAIFKKSQWFESTVVCRDFFSVSDRVNAIGVYDGGRRLLFGTDTGIYLSTRKPHSMILVQPIRILSLPNVSQLEVIEEYNLLLLLSDKVLYSYSLSWISTEVGQAPRKPKKISGHTSFFKVGICLGKVLVCIVKSSTLSTTIKVLEPVQQLARTSKQAGLKKLLAVSQDPLRVLKELYMPTESTSIHFLKNKLCVGCTRGFEVVSLDNLETQSLLDPADTSLEFVERRENIKPIAIYRMNGGEFLLCYSEFAFYVNRNGWRSRPTWFVVWEGCPQKFALSYPYILAFEPSFIEVRHVETAKLVHVITGYNIRLLADGRGKLGEGGEIFYATDERTENGDTSVICALQLVDKNLKLKTSNT
ncbi:Rho1 guanine nucleotide exchange factor 1 [Schizosaccharomyces japonicus yFS275]|uniref:Rho1 guanine nucleotide exchange factor 1 n=1 Tax=Schizosaccharomyces japonicus (strain yFS275 / FY16936) TaxID=402676 RepID=B6K4Z0_SCHJY|nr:Rho1 guanine nucleotide exchange factor 1 [Schizosaccharomyces japonicus yFS275]EEB08547.1 Rho1 guanine nucleotide exchange factor 1 [Schizosaccharomyces japonicus yFS275]